MRDIFEEIKAERKRQDEKWGEQNHPMLGVERWSITNGVEYPAKDILENQLVLTRNRINDGKHGWFDILLEEICGAFLESDSQKQRAEMIQVAAVAVAIIECLDRKIQGEEGNETKS
jgi:hypothetical protein